MAYSQILLDRAEPIRDKIFQHPFVRGLGDGTLPQEKFAFYLGQDYLFLIEYCRVLALAVAKGPDSATMARVAELLHSTLTVEMELHRSYSAECGLGPEALERTPAAATTCAYTNHLLSVAWGGSVAEIAASLLPCQWGYWELGCRLAEQAKTTGPQRYHRWIESYSAPEFGELAGWIRGLVDRAEEGRRSGELGRMQRAFELSSRYELMFWDMAWHGELWPG